MARRTTKKKNPTSKRSLKYKKRDYAAGRKRAEQSASTRDNYINDDIRLFKPAEGENLIRILPPTWDEPEHYGLDIYVHYNIGVDNAAYLCPLKNKGEPCPICEAREEAEAEGDTDYAKTLKPTKRVLFYLVDRDKEDEGIKGWASPWTIDKDIAVQATDSRNREYFPVDDPEEGYDVSITREGVGTATKYSVAIARRQSEIELTDDIMDVLEDMPVPEMLVYYDYEHIEKVFAGSAAAHEQDDDDEKEEKEKPSRSSKSRKSKVATPTYEELYELTGEDIDKLIDGLGLDIDPNSFDSDDDLLDAIAEDLGLEEDGQETGTDEDEDKDSGGDDSDPKEEDSDSGESEGKKKVRNRLAGLRNRKNK